MVGRLRLLILGLLFLWILSGILIPLITKKENRIKEWREGLSNYVENRMIEIYLPIFTYANAENDRRSALSKEEVEDLKELLQEEGKEEETGAESAKMEQTGKGVLVLDEKWREQLEMENQKSQEIEEKEQAQETEAEDRRTTLDIPTEFVPAQTKKQEYQWDYFTDQDEFLQTFYAIDASTEVKNENLTPQALLSKDMRLMQDNQAPQILIYHTHSQEEFADSIPGDDATTIMGAGERLAEILRDTYHFNVIHHMGKYDVDGRDYAYSNALPDIERVLSENPSIEVVIDLHRDAVADDRRLVADIDGRTCAQFMFFNGLSHTRKKGDIDYLDNPYKEDNLAFSFQMQVLAGEYYPGITRKIYLKGYRYNMHLRPKTLLIELGAQTNTLEEVNHSLDVIAHLLAMELQPDTVQ